MKTLVRFIGGGVDEIEGAPIFCDEGMVDFVDADMGVIGDSIPVSRIESLEFFPHEPGETPETLDGHVLSPVIADAPAEPIPTPDTTFEPVTVAAGRTPEPLIHVTPLVTFAKEQED